MIDFAKKTEELRNDKAKIEILAQHIVDDIDLVKFQSFISLNSEDLDSLKSSVYITLLREFNSIT